MKQKLFHFISDMKRYYGLGIYRNYLLKLDGTLKLSCDISNNDYFNQSISSWIVIR